jgi:hypothetical protein
MRRQQADVIARMLDSTAQLRIDTPTMRPGWLALLIADAHLLTRLVGNGWDRETCEALSIYVRSAAKL